MTNMVLDLSYDWGECKLATVYQSNEKIGYNLVCTRGRTKAKKVSHSSPTQLPVTPSVIATHFFVLQTEWFNLAWEMVKFKIIRPQTRLRREAKYVRQNEFVTFRSFYVYSSWCT